MTFVSGVSDKLTLIVTTSPVPSAPSPELLETVFASFRKHCPSLLECNVILVIDTYERIAETPRLKKGCITFKDAEAFEAYRRNVKELVMQTFTRRDEGTSPESGMGRKLEFEVQDAEFGSPGREENSIPLRITRTKDKRITFIEPTARIGFALAVRSALRLTETPYLWVHQHDWTLKAPILVKGMLDIMSRHSSSDDEAPVQYIVLASVRLLNYGTQAENVETKSFRDLTATYRRTFTPPSSSSSEASIEIHLTPLFLWHDKPHLCSTAHYLSRIFPSRYATKRGTFIEDTIGHRMRAQIKEDPEVWRMWGTWVYCPTDPPPSQGPGLPVLCLRHLQGRTRFDEKGQEDRVTAWKTDKKSGRRRRVQYEAVVGVSEHKKEDGGSKARDCDTQAVD